MSNSLDGMFERNAIESQKTPDAPKPTCGRFDLVSTPEERGKVKIIVKDAAGQIVFADVIKPSEAAKRAKFIKELSEAVELADDEKTAISTELLNLSEAVIFTQTDGEAVETSFQILNDGRIIEQIFGGFALYDPRTLKAEIVQEAESDGILYKPVDDELFTQSGGLALADDLTEYGTDAELFAEIESYLKKYLDLKPIYFKICTLYVFLTYLFDKTPELSYLMPTGELGSGKSKLGSLVVGIARRGLMLTAPSAASLYRIVDQFAPTLFLDEFNMNNSEDAQGIIQILNAGFQNLTKIPRMMPTASGTYKSELFSAYCPKVIGGLSKSQSDALNSRCIQIVMERTQRDDFPFSVYSDQIRAGQQIRNKLTLWRLRNFHTDFDEKRRNAEIELKQTGVMPRYIQANLPLVALMNDVALKNEFFALLKDADKSHKADRRQSIEGVIVEAIHYALFEEEIDENVSWRIDRPNDGDLCTALSLEKLVAFINNDRKERDKIDLRYLGSKLSALNLERGKIRNRNSEFYEKRVIVFDSHKFSLLFRNFGLSVPADFAWTHWTQDAKTTKSNDLECVQEKPENNSNNSLGRTLNAENTTLKQSASNASKSFTEKPESLENERLLISEVI